MENKSIVDLIVVQIKKATLNVLTTESLMNCVDEEIKISEFCDILAEADDLSKAQSARAVEKLRVILDFFLAGCENCQRVCEENIQKRLEKKVKEKIELTLKKLQQLQQ